MFGLFCSGVGEGFVRQWFDRYGLDLLMKLLEARKWRLALPFGHTVKKAITALDLTLLTGEELVDFPLSVFQGFSKFPMRE